MRPGARDPRLSYVSLDIETDGIDGEILSIALCNKDAEMIFMQGEAAHWESDLPIRWFGDEAALLTGFLGAFRALDPDLLLGWARQQINPTTPDSCVRKYLRILMTSRISARAETDRNRTEYLATESLRPANCPKKIRASRRRAR